MQVKCEFDSDRWDMVGFTPPLQHCQLEETNQLECLHNSNWLSNIEGVGFSKDFKSRQALGQFPNVPRSDLA